jgi:CspA family cold shock protein
VATGIVKFFNESKGRGAIIADHGGPDLPFDRSRIMGPMTVSGGQRVEFEEIQGPRGKEATTIRPL